MVKCNGDNLIYGKDLDTPPDICEASLDALMDRLSCPDMPVFEILQDVDLAGPLWGILKPAIPITVISKPVLSRTGSKNLVPRPLISTRRIRF
jgi:hypothetical protein